MMCKVDTVYNPNLFWKYLVEHTRLWLVQEILAGGGLEGTEVRDQQSQGRKIPRYFSNYRVLNYFRIFSLLI